MIQRTTRAMVKGRVPLAWTASRNWEMFVDGASERRWSVQTGMIDGYTLCSAV